MTGRYNPITNYPTVRHPCFQHLCRYRHITVLLWFAWACFPDITYVLTALPTATKLAQAAKFNDPNDPCKIMVATDAIGMGLNL